MTPLVTTDWLAAEHGAPDLLLFDASFYLPNEGDAKAGFATAHLPGARFFDIEDVADPDTDLPHMVPSAGRFAKKMAEYGVSNASRIVFYDQVPNFRSARALWLMRLFGHDMAAVLDGGLKKWQAEGRPVEQGDAPAVTAPTDFVAQLHAARLRGLGDMKQNLATGSDLVLDARPAGRFEGTAPEPRPGLPNGHMPGAVNIPASDMVGPGGMFLDATSLRARFARAGVDGTRSVVTSCGTGVTAAILTLGLRLAGLPEGALYDGSWTEWASQADTPKVR